MKRFAPLVAIGALIPLAFAAAGVSSGAAARTVRLPKIGHVFVINLENENFDSSWGATSPAKYLNTTLRARGVLLTQYFGVAHNSLPNYVAQISGQGPNPQTQADCQIYGDFVRVATTSDGQAVGHGCVFPAGVRTIADQLTADDRTWKGYMEDMANSSTESATCRHPALNSRDDTQSARIGDEYATRHNPFMYFHSIIDSPA